MLFWFILVPLAVALLVAAVLLYQRWQQMEVELDRLTRELHGADGTTRDWISGQGDTVLTIEVLNPVELARSRSRLGAQLASVAPNLVRKKVYDQVASELIEELAARGVEADVRVQRAPGGRKSL